MSMIGSPRHTEPLPVEKLRADFPLLASKSHGRPLAYLDSAATSQKPRVVIDAVSRYYAEQNANIHRGVYELSERATEAYEGARARAAGFVNAAEPREIVFLRGCTEAVNLVAWSWGREHIGEGDEVLVTHMEHHANIVPWQMLCQQQGARLRVAPIDDRGDLVLDELERLLNERTRLVALTHVSNALGTVNPVARVVELAHARGIKVLVDGAQAAPHMPVDVQQLGCDFYTVSGHKMFGPTGIGFLYARRELLERMPPWQGGGDMIRSVSFEGTTYNDAPWRFEAGTPHIAGAVGLAAAIEYLDQLDFEAAMAHESELVQQACERLAELPGVRFVGQARQRCSLVSFVMDGVHPHDIGTILDTEGVAIRAGHHCAQPVMERFGVPATARASFACYNNHEDVERLIAGVQRVIEVFG